MVANFKQKQKQDRFLRLLFSLGGVLAIVLALFLVAADVNVYYKKRELNRQIADLRRKIAATEKQNEKLERGIEESDNEAYIEKIAREDLNLQKHGEKVVSFIMPESATKKEMAEEKGFFAKWLGWIGSIFN